MPRLLNDLQSSSSYCSISTGLRNVIHLEGGDRFKCAARWPRTTEPAGCEKGPNSIGLKVVNPLGHLTASWRFINSIPGVLCQFVTIAGTIFRLLRECTPRSLHRNCRAKESVTTAESEAFMCVAAQAQALNILRLNPIPSAPIRRVT